MIHEIHVVGKPVVGNVLVADAEYWGGTEGMSLYQWTRVKGGIRKKGDLKAIDPSKHTKFNSRLMRQLREKGIITKDDLPLTNVEDDPRCYIVTEDDVGAKFKVSITPKNVAGAVGGKFTYFDKFLFASQCSTNNNLIF
jgi:hypothetical protein